MYMNVLHDPWKLLINIATIPTAATYLELHATNFVFTPQLLLIVILKPKIPSMMLMINIDYFGL